RPYRPPSGRPGDVAGSSRRAAQAGGRWPDGAAAAALPGAGRGAAVISSGLWLAVAFVVATVATYVLAVLTERFGRRLGVLDVPRAGEVQRWAVPRTGGYAMLGGLWLTLLVGYALRSRLLVDPDLGPEWNPADDLR